MHPFAFVRHIAGRTLVILGSLTLLTLTLAPNVAAADYYSDVAKVIGVKRLYISSNAKPSVSNDQASSLSKQINSSPTPLFVALLDNNQLGTSNADELPARLHTALNKPGVYAVSSKLGFRAQGFDVPTAVAVQVKPIADQVVADSESRHGGKGKAVPAEVYQTFVSRIAAIKVSNAGSPGTNHTAPPKEGLSAGAWTLIILVSLIGLGLIIWGAVALTRSRRKGTDYTKSGDKLDKDSLERKSRNLGPRVLSLMDRFPAGSPEANDLDLAQNDLTSANDALSAKRPNLRSAADYMASAETIITRLESDGHQNDDTGDSRTAGTTAHFVDKPTGTSRSRGRSRTTSTKRSKGSTRSTRSAGSQPSGDIRVSNGGNTVTVNNTTMLPQTSPSAAYPYQFGGGYVGGQWFGPGYYGTNLDPLLTYLIVDDLLDHDRYDHDDRGYDGNDRDDHYDGGRSDSEIGGSSWEATTDDSRSDSEVGGGSWDGSDNGSDSSTEGATGWDSVSNTSGFSSSDSGSSGSDYGSSDSGGGDWGGSSSDSGSSDSGSGSDW